MAIKVNRELLPVKAHYFFFFAALGPVLPQLNVYGRQLGVSPEVMGLVTAVLPLLWAAAKPCFGYLVDYFTNQRKLIFMLLILVMSWSYCGLCFLPQPTLPHSTGAILETVYHLNGTIYLKSIRNTSIPGHANDTFNLKTFNEAIDLVEEKENVTGKESADNVTLDGSVQVFKKYTCGWDCFKIENFEIYLIDSKNVYLEAIYIDDVVTNETCTKYGMEFVHIDDDIECRARNKCNLLCVREEASPESDNKNNTNDEKTDLVVNVKNIDSVNSSKVETFDNGTTSELKTDMKEPMNAITDVAENGEHIEENARNDNTETVGSAAKRELRNDTKELMAATVENGTNNLEDLKEQRRLDTVGSIYGTVTFWGFVILMCVGTVAFNVANCISDAICFDVLGAKRNGLYGNQRAWGTAGYGATAFLGGWLVDMWSGGAWKDFTPAFALTAVFTLLDILSCRQLTLPRLSSAAEGGGGGALRAVLRCPRVLLFIVFAVVAGMFDSFIIYYLFWYIEELADAAGGTDSVKLLEGVIIFGQSFVGEIIFFFLSGGILKRFGHGTTMTFCLFCYGLRLAFVSLISNPWHLVPLEAVMQGPTYALCYATIVGYAAAVAPEGHSATMQGIVAGMDDGVGFALGSLLGGQLYGHAGGCAAFRVMAGVAVAAAALHALLHATVLARPPRKAGAPAADAPHPDEGERMLDKMAAARPDVAGDAVYCETVVPLYPAGEKVARGINNAW